VADTGTETRPAWYAAQPGAWRDWVTVLHPPYTAWHLGYVLVGAGLARRVDFVRLAGTLLAFGLAVGVAAHALDELRGRPLRTRISSRALAVAAALALASAAVIGGIGIHVVGLGLLGFVVAGVVLVVGYNLELLGGRLHNDIVFAAAWGGFPVLTSFYAQTSSITVAAVAGAAFAYGASHAQRVLSAEARHLRRRVTSVSGVMASQAGEVRELTKASLLLPLERALRALSWSTCALGVAMVVART
jgi:hypothetical protein